MVRSELCGLISQLMDYVPLLLRLPPALGDTSAMAGAPQSWGSLSSG